MDPKLPYGTNYCKCSACSEYFNSEKAFAMHRIGPPGERECLCEAEMLEKGMDRNRKGYWVSRLLKTAPIYLSEAATTHDQTKVIPT